MTLFFPGKKIVPLIDRDEWKAMTDMEKIQEVCELTDQGPNQPRPSYEYLSIFLDDVRILYRDEMRMRKALYSYSRLLLALLLIVGAFAVVSGLLLIAS